MKQTARFFGPRVGHDIICKKTSVISTVQKNRSRKKKPYQNRKFTKELNPNHICMHVKFTKVISKKSLSYHPTRQTTPYNRISHHLLFKKMINAYNLQLAS